MMNFDEQQNILLHNLNSMHLEEAEQLKEALFYRDEFLSIASHELKTPLTSLKLHSQIFKRSVKRNDPEAYSKEKIDRLMDHIDGHVTRLVSLVDDMLDISRIRTGNMVMNKEKVIINDLIVDVIDKYKTQFSKPDQVSVLLQDQVEMFCDRERIKQVISNILNNALRYGHGRPIEVQLSQINHSVIITIKDQGRGIPLNEQPKIFEKFRRAIPASEISGLGLGLFITKQIVEAHRGFIELQSEVNVGTTFTVTMPVRCL